MQDFVLPSVLSASSSVPTTINAPQLNLDSLPVLNLNDKMRSRFIVTLTSFRFSSREREIRDEIGDSGISADNSRLNFKRVTLHHVHVGVRIVGWPDWVICTYLLR